ncbi:RNA polymerase sigma-70 factor [Cellulophaga sp. F20128]|uniref:RNA polymerase sigma-70 factor n=1 Tax=Cellulophaga sp. F20128 TaxID=2926413 RepID=UPI001FF25ECD|nr:RNA polymerase sigma-70 factor [Cellulophaga sp. F20128]MCK0156474.1 RNA polymerase sigma-70 factor [Cellulophaga sp. F20128]
MVVKEFTSDDFLISELQKSNEAAFDYLFRKYYKGLCVNAKSYVHDMDKAQSLVQDCFVKLWSSRENICEISNLSAYLAFMVRNRCIDHIRKTRAQENVYEKLEKKEAVSNTDEHLLHSEFEEKLRCAISVLPKRSKLAFEYSRFENLTYKEIGDKMDISGKAVEALVSRALRLLRNDLNGYFYTVTIGLLVLCKFFQA